MAAAPLGTVLSTGTIHECRCSPGFTGRHCETLGVDYCPKNCSGTNGRCDRVCVCSDGFAGDDCSQHACPGNCTSERHGHCDGSTGQCRCSPGFFGFDCSFPLCPNNCTGRGICSLVGAHRPDAPVQDTFCACQNNFSGDDCSAAAEGGPVRVENSGICRLHCSGHGLCQRDRVFIESSDEDTLLTEARLVAGAPYCACERGFSGSQCETECPFFCSGNGRCQADGSCLCDEGFAGSGCNRRYCVNNCLDRGSCNSETGECNCRDGYTGSYCQLDVTCSGNGQLDPSTRNETCKCKNGFGGLDCSLRLRCLDNCNGRGTCTLQIAAEKLNPDVSVDSLMIADPAGSAVFDGACLCDDGFMGVSCESRKCPKPSTDTGMVCSGNGKCNGETGACECWSGFYGDACEVQIECPGNCTGTHGACLESGECRCVDGWTGASCDIIGCPADCSGHGACIDGLCLCEPGFSGVSCNVTCLQGCEHGVCIEGVCHCDPLHHGTFARADILFLIFLFEFEFISHRGQAYRVRKSSNVPLRRRYRALVTVGATQRLDTVIVCLGSTARPVRSVDTALEIEAMEARNRKIEAQLSVTVMAVVCWESVSATRNGRVPPV